MAMHTWPELNMAAAKIFGATSFGSASSSTIAASLPPSSRVRRFRVPAALAITFLPVAVEPVNATLATSGWPVRAAPRSFWSTMTLTTPGGRILAQSSPNLSVVSGVVGAGLSHHRVAGEQGRRDLDRSRIIGKFHGVIAATTPSGLCCWITFCAASSLSTSSGRSSVAK